MHFCRGRMRDSHLGPPAQYPSEGSRSGEGAKPSYEGPVSPTGPEFPQALLTSRRPVIPPDRAPFLLDRDNSKAGGGPLRLITWNINSVRLRIGLVRRLL